MIPELGASGGRVSSIVGDDGHFIGFEPIICRDDEEAIVKAQSLVIGHDIELWSGDRFVTLLRHQPTNSERY